MCYVDEMTCQSDHQEHGSRLKWDLTEEITIRQECDGNFLCIYYILCMFVIYIYIS